MNFLDTNKLKLIKTEDGRFNAIYDQKEYKAIKLYYCFPLKEPTKYISVRYQKDETELGIIETIESLDEESKKIVLNELKFRYFMPEITKIYHHKFNQQTSVFDVETTAGRKKITILNLVWNIFENPDGSIMLKDSEENYYLIKEYLNHPDKHIKFLRNYL